MILGQILVDFGQILDPLVGSFSGLGLSGFWSWFWANFGVILGSEIRSKQGFMSKRDCSNYIAKTNMRSTF